MTIHVEQASFQWIINIPFTLIVLAAIAGSFLLTRAMDWSDFVSLLLTLLFLAVGIGLYSVALPHLRKLVSRELVMTIEEGVLRVESRGKTDEIDFTTQYAAKVEAGNTQFTSADTVVTSVALGDTNNPLQYNISLQADKSERAAAAFDNPYFVGSAPLPMFGIALDPGNAQHVAFLDQLLDVLGQYKQQNVTWQAFTTFPWDSVPTPQIGGVETREQNDPLVENVMRDVVWHDEVMWVSKDYVMLSQKKGFVVFPIDATTATHRQTTGGGNSSTSVNEYLDIRGTTSGGDEKTASVSWPDYKEREDRARVFVRRFINTR